MATKERKTAVDIDDILLREVAARRSTSGSVLDQRPEDTPASPMEVPPRPEDKPETPAGEEETIRSAPARPSRQRDGAAPSPYETLFLRPGTVAQRSGIYIGAATKRKLSEVVRRLGWSTRAGSTFADNILSHHLDLFRDEINRLYRKKNAIDLL